MTGTFVNKIYPDQKQTKQMQEVGPDGSIVMVNLLKFREKALYKDRRESDLTGHAAYGLYAQKIPKLIKEYGGRILFAGDTTFLSLGEVTPLWDEVALALYPTRKALFDMSTSRAWQEIAIHREAGLEGQLNIETSPSYLPKEL